MLFCPGHFQPLGLHIAGWKRPNINDPSQGWDGLFRGRMMDPGVYVYFFEVVFADGSVRLYKGDVTLVR